MVAATLSPQAPTDRHFEAERHNAIDRRHAHPPQRVSAAACASGVRKIGDDANRVNEGVRVVGRDAFRETRSSENIVDLGKHGLADDQLERVGVEPGSHDSVQGPRCIAADP